MFSFSSLLSERCKCGVTRKACSLPHLIVYSPTGTVVISAERRGKIFTVYTGNRYLKYFALQKTFTVSKGNQTSQIMLEKKAPTFFQKQIIPYHTVADEDTLPLKLVKRLCLSNHVLGCITHPERCKFLVPLTLSPQ